MNDKHRGGYQYPASRLRLIRGKWHVIISIPAHMRYLYNGTQRDKRKSTWLAVTDTTYLHADGTTRYTNGTTVSLDALLTQSTTQGNN